ncbi:hypothetical protein [Brevundimonas sp.]|uniref:hypothetical protein n=1 Tax=Brevundimonas sp. TaxID=1871086 RepID=UPI003D0D4442
MGKRSKLSEEQWEALFGMDRAGVRRADLAGWYGISVGTICWQARRRGRMKGGDPVAVDRRRRPVEGWAEDHVFAQSRSGMTPGRWRQLLDRRNAGEADEALAFDYRVHPSTIAAAAKRYRMRKCDLAGAVWRPRGPQWGSGPARPELGFRIDRHDARVHREAVARLVLLAAQEGRMDDIRELLRTSAALDTLIPGPWHAKRRG